jgi:hypothetical protein
MIKNFESFVNEGFLDSIAAGIDAGIGAFKANRSAEKAADEDLKHILNGESEVASDKTKMHVLIKQLVERSAWLADGFSWDDITTENGSVTSVSTQLSRIERIELILSEMKTILKENFEVE